MSETRKPVRTLEISVDVDAPIEDLWRAITEAPHLASWFPPVVETAGKGAGSTVTFDFGEGMRWTTSVDAFQPGKLLRWVDQAEWVAPGAVMHVEFHLTTEKGHTVVKLVQSGFGESDAWDGLFAGTDAGWRYFMRNLKHYVERHLGTPRHMISDRVPVTLPRDAAWQGILADKADSLRPGQRVQLDLTGKPVAAVIDALVPGRVMGIMIPEWDDALLMLELEQGDPEYKLGVWLSVYDTRRAAALRPLVQKRLAKLRKELAGN